MMMMIAENIEIKITVDLCLALSVLSVGLAFTNISYLFLCGSYELSQKGTSPRTNDVTLEIPWNKQSDYSPCLPKIGQSCIYSHLSLFVLLLERVVSHSYKPVFLKIFTAERATARWLSQLSLDLTPPLSCESFQGSASLKDL